MPTNLLRVNHFDVNTQGLIISNIKTGAGDNSVADGQDVNNPFVKGLMSLESLLLALQQIVNAYYDGIETSSNRARNTQDMANRMDEVIADAAKGDDKTRKPVPDEVVKYMRDNDILVDGKRIDDYISDHGGTDGLDKGSLQAIKAALDNSANRDTDLSSQQQLKLQNELQKYNADVTQESGLNSKLGDLLSMIAQKMY